MKFTSPSPPPPPPPTQMKGAVLKRGRGGGGGGGVQPHRARICTDNSTCMQMMCTSQAMGIPEYAAVSEKKLKECYAS